MKIAHIHWSLGTGGVETMLPDIMNEQAKENDVALFVINDWVEDFILSKINKIVKVYFIKRKKKSKNPLSIVKLNLLLAMFRPDIIHTHAYREINLVLYPFGKRVRTIHNTNNISSEYSNYDALISISKTVWNFTKEQGFDSIIVDNGISTHMINAVKSSVFSDGYLHFIQVSRLDVEQKGQDVLLDALGILKKSGFSGFIMHFIGKGGDEQMLIDKTKQLDLQDNVIFEGLKDQQWIYNNLCNYDLFIQPSRYEGFGLTVAEAMIAKVPVLVSGIEGPMEIIDNGRLGMYFQVNDSENLVERLKLFIEKGRNEKQIEEAYQYVVNHYDVSLTAQKYLEVYKKIL